MTKPTPRVAARPDPLSWGDDELMTPQEAAALLWPDGLITQRTLRTAVRDGKLPISQVAGKFFVTEGRAEAPFGVHAARRGNAPRRRQPPAEQLPRRSGSHPRVAPGAQALTRFPELAKISSPPFSLRRH